MKSPHPKARTTRRTSPRRVRRIPEPQLFEQLRIDGLLSAFRSLDKRRQQQVIGFAETVALDWMRTMAARNATRGTNVRNLTGWIISGTGAR